MCPLRKLICSLLMFSLLATSLGGPLSPVSKAYVRNSANERIDNQQTTAEETGLRFHLSSGAINLRAREQAGPRS